MKLRTGYWSVKNRGAAEQRALLERVRAAGVDVDIDEALAVGPGPLLVEQSGPDALLFDLEPFGTGLIVQIGITCKASKFFRANCAVTLPSWHATFEFLELHDMTDKFREYAFPGKRSETRSYSEVVNHRLDRLRRDDYVEGALLAMTNTPMPANWSTGRIWAKLAILDHQGNGYSTEVGLFVKDPKTRNGLLAAKDSKRGLRRPVRGDAGKGVALADSFDDGAPEGSQEGLAIQVPPMAGSKREAEEGGRKKAGCVDSSVSGFVRPDGRSVGRGT